MNKDSIITITDTIGRIYDIERKVRQHINTHRYQEDLIHDSNIWNQICSSLDTIGDTLYSFKDYINSDYPDTDGLKYIYTYGILQAVFIQQDAIRNLSEAFEFEYELSETLKKIRNIRNSSIGHPTKNKIKKETYYNYISRITLSKYGFTLLRSSEKNRTAFISVNLINILKDQLFEIEKNYKLISLKLIEADKLHKEKFKNQLLIDIFHSSMDYSFSKIAEGIHSLDSSNNIFAQTMLNSIQETYHEFEIQLKARNELHEYTKYDLDEYNHALSMLEDYLTTNSKEITENDANIYHFFITENHGRFVQIAKQIDDEYLNQ